MPRPTLLELAVQDVAGLRAAADVGAARVELCAALGPTGGLTPSIGMIEAVVAAGGAAASPSAARRVEVHPLIRSRPGGFVCDDGELAVQLRDVRAAVAAGASGVVVGVLTQDRTVDADAVAALIDAAGDREVTFHRAIDTLDDPLAAIDVLVGLGVTRVLTSGGAPRSIDGVERLRKMVAHADGRLEIMAGGGVRPGDVAALVRAGVDAIHLSAKVYVTDAAGVGGGSEDGYEVTDALLAREAAEALSAAGSCG